MKRLITILVLSFLLSACAISPLREPIPTFENYTDNTPVIFVHGLFGARIRDQETGKGVWPGSIFRFLRKTFIGLGVNINAETLEPKLNPYQAYSPFYGYRPKSSNRTWKLLKKYAGYQLCDIDQVYDKGTRCYYFFVYDWRKDLVEVAGELDTFIDQVRFDHGNPGLKVNLVGNSLGGLVVRYFLAYGSVDVLNPPLRGITPTYDGKRKVNKVIYIGAPLKGSMLGFRALMKGYRFGLAKVQPETVTTMASLYYLFPHPDMIWLQNPYGHLYFDKENYDLYDIKTWERFRLGIFNPKSEKRIERRFKRDEKLAQEVYPLDKSLAWAAYLGTLRRYFKSRLERGRLFHLALDKYDAAGEYAFFGVCEPTPYRAVLEEIRPGKYFISFYPGKIKKPVKDVDYKTLMMSPGDNTVVAPSKPDQLLSRMEIVEVCAKHASIYTNRDVIRRALIILLTNSGKLGPPEIPAT